MGARYHKTDISSKTFASMRYGLLGVIASLMLLISASANATLMIEIDVGIDSTIDFTAIDNGANDFNGSLGQITALTNVGGSFFNISAESGAPNVGELIDINFLATLAPNSSWQIRIVDDMFQLGTGNTTATSAVTPTTIRSNHTITVETRIDNQTVLGPTQLASGVNQSNTVGVVIAQPTTIEHIITLVSDGTSSNLASTFDTRTDVVAVTEPNVLGMIGIGFMGLVFVSSRRRRIKA